MTSAPDRYLRDRGFSDDTVAQLGWRTGPLNGTARRYALPAGVQVWFIPYLVGGQPAFERVRLLDNADVAAVGGSKYRQPSKTPLRSYDPDGRLEGPPLDRLVIVEGEANAASIRQMKPDLPVVGLPSKTGLPAYLGVAVRHTNVWLWLDAGEQGTDDAIQRIGDLLRRNGVGEVLVVAAPAGCDANDLLQQQNGERILDDLLATAVSITATDNPTLLTAPSVVKSRLTVPPPTTNTVSSTSLLQSQLPQRSSSITAYTPPEGATLQRFLAHDEAAVGPVSEMLLDVKLGEQGRCCLPGHRGTAMILPDPVTGEFRYHELRCRNQEQGGRSLAEVRASVAYRRNMSLTPTARWVWFDRLLWEAAPSLVRIAAVQIPEMPPWATDVQWDFAMAFLLLLGLRRADPSWANSPVAFAREFAAAYAGHIRRDDPQAAHAGRVLRELKKLDILREVGQKHPREFLPGEGRWRR